MGTLRVATRAVLLTVVAGLLAACASAPPLPPPRRMEAGDFKLLAGEWTGTSDTQGELSTAILGVIYEAGSFFIAPRTTPGAQLPGVMRIVNGEVEYETTTSKGKMTFHETSTEWTWKWDGKTKAGEKPVRHELRRAK